MNEDAAHHKERITKYGTNKPEEVEIKTLWDIICEALEDKLLRFLVLSAVVATVLGIWKEGIATVSKFSIQVIRAGLMALLLLLLW